ncbi:uncharacterized protein TM35_000222510 [Trypanosoma theileri]|uniref:Uncharacterized protein n=1 Tax=Trypanosoma theileri TaxID=67003 RepID=A0A1X0NRX6_9TRYP|nr:uncharacterized protein TM35_000222510 [Trypanosoma theileri]ORC87452.1 hypothetical protein TM35_000222510 [Trypanosoma theileri]
MAREAFMSGVNDSSSNDSSDPNHTYTLLSNTQFAFLVIFSVVCHYVALIFSATAVGESTSTLLLPFVVFKRLFMGFLGTIAKYMRRRQEHVFVGVSYEDDVEGGDNFDAINLPADRNFT